MLSELDKLNYQLGTTEWLEGTFDHLFRDYIDYGHNKEQLDYILNSNELVERVNITKYFKRWFESNNVKCINAAFKEPLFYKNLNIMNHHGQMLLNLLNGNETSDRIIYNLFNIPLLKSKIDIHFRNDLFIRKAIAIEKVELVQYLLERNYSEDKKSIHANNDSIFKVLMEMKVRSKSSKFDKLIDFILFDYNN